MVERATSTVPALTWAKAKVVVGPPSNAPKTRFVIGFLLWISVTCKAYRLPSTETFDQGYWVNWLKLLSSPALSVVRRGRPEPAVFIFHNPFWLVSTLTPAPQILFSINSSSLGLL